MLIHGRKNVFFFVAFYISAAVSIAISAFAAYDYFSGQSDIIGQSLISTELPPHTISPIYIKPATALMISSIVCWYCIVEIVKPRLSPDRRTRRPWSLKVVVAILVVIAIVSFYEVLFNFFLWGSLMAKSDNDGSFNPDTFVNSYPSDRYKINLTFATKVGVTIFGCSVYGIYALRGLKEQQSS